MSSSQSFEDLKPNPSVFKLAVSIRRPLLDALSGFPLYSAIILRNSVTEVYHAKLSTFKAHESRFCFSVSRMSDCL